MNRAEPSTPTVAIELRDLWKSFDDGATYVVQGVSLQVYEGETLALLGASGCGKTTTLKMINRLIDPTRGEIWVYGRNALETPPTELRRQMGYVFQGVGLMPHMTVLENVGLTLRLQGVPRSQWQARACELLSLMGLPPTQFADRYPDELSGGQQQRVGVARALAHDPPLLLMDEPFGALDAITRESLQDELVRLKQQLRKTIVFVTHDLFEALRIADRVAVMHEGRIEQVGTPAELLSHPATPFVAQLMDKPRRAADLLQSAS